MVQRAVRAPVPEVEVLRDAEGGVVSLADVEARLAGGGVDCVEVDAATVVGGGAEAGVSDVGDAGVGGLIGGLCGWVVGWCPLRWAELERLTQRADGSLRTRCDGGCLAGCNSREEPRFGRVHSREIRRIFGSDGRSVNGVFEVGARVFFAHD